MKQLNINKQKLEPLNLPVYHQQQHQYSLQIRKPTYSLHEQTTSRQSHQRKKQKQVNVTQNSPPKYQDQQILVDKFGLNERFQYTLRISVRTKQGMIIGNPTKQNQDSYILLSNISNKTYMHYFLVFDGHGVNGHHVSNFLKQQFQLYTTQFSQLLENNPQFAIQTIFTHVSQALNQSGIDLKYSGSTVIGLFMLHNKIYCSNLGDSRAIMLSRHNRWILKYLSRDHKPQCADEAQRIINYGGRIDSYRDSQGLSYGPLRVWSNANVPGLAMTRSMGDQVAKKVGVIDKPEIFNFTMDIMDRALLIGSDGLFEFLTQQDIFDAITPYLNNIEMACNHLLEMAHISWLQRGSKMIDDITFILIFLQY
ncbi:unnamed protein product [Paramecium pentaurelia]|uniref:PPM-type phosphatase domain-containing protein n=1 Tax=Paramecium pentaurelia TaxID=43138 RepID=A0A8S1Y940_9CILI|nr:unnamed protein product [Paramecium pentaurelia]